MPSITWKVSCAFLATLWLATVITLTRFCVAELRILKAEKTGIVPDSFHSETLTFSTRDTGESPLVDLLRRIHEESEHEESEQVESGLRGSTVVMPPNVESEKVESAETMNEDVYAEQTEPTPTGHLVIHVGPSKTATTSLQTDLTKAYDIGWLGNGIVYSGRYYRPFVRDEILLLNRSESQLLVEARRMFHQSSMCEQPSARCCANFTKELQLLQNQTLILSDEAFANMWTTPAHFRAMREAIPSYWKVTIVASYRRFYEWIISSKYQRDRTDRISRYGKVLWPSDGGRPLLPMFPDTFQTWENYFHYTDKIIQNAAGSFPVQILNMHSESGSIRTQFLCTLNLSEGCREAKLLDSKPQTILNAQETTTISSLYYDAIATAAYDEGLIGTPNSSRAQVREAIRFRHEEINHDQPSSLPMQCPSSGELKALLDLSLALERDFFPQFGNETAHALGFWEKVNAQQYCWVNTTLVLNQKPWKEFFSTVYSDIEV